MLAQRLKRSLANGWSWLRNMLSVEICATCCPLKMQITINVDRFLDVLFKLTLKMQQTENVENLSIDILALFKLKNVEHATY